MGTMCIYQITGPSGCIYRGSAIDFNNRRNIHISNLKKNKHHSKYMQNHCNKYGIGKFAFEILELVEKKEDLLKIEQKWLDDLFATYPKDKIYNTCVTAGSHLGIKHSEETRRKISKSNTGKLCTEETRRKISKSNTGRLCTEETKRKRSEAGKRRKHSDETKLKQSRAAGFETCYVIDKEGNIYLVENQKQFCRDHNLHNGNFCHMLKGRHKSCGGFRLYNKG